MEKRLTFAQAAAITPAGVVAAALAAWAAGDLDGFYTAQDAFKGNDHTMYQAHTGAFDADNAETNAIKAAEVKAANIERANMVRANATRSWRAGEAQAEARIMRQQERYDTLNSRY